MVGDPGIEPGVSRLEGVTVPCHTLRPDAQPVALDSCRNQGRQHEIPLRVRVTLGIDAGLWIWGGTNEETEVGR